MSELPSASDNVQHSKGYLEQISAVRRWDNSWPPPPKPWINRSQENVTVTGTEKQWRRGKRIRAIMADDGVWSQPTFDTPLREMVEMLKTQVVPPDYPQALKTELESLLPQLPGLTREHLLFATIMHGERLAERIQRDPASRTYLPLPAGVLSEQYRTAFGYDDVYPDLDSLHQYRDVVSTWKRTVGNSEGAPLDPKNFAGLAKLVEIGFREIAYWPGYIRYLYSQAIKNTNLPKEQETRESCDGYEGFFQKKIIQVQQRVKEETGSGGVFESDEDEPPDSVFVDAYESVVRALKARTESIFDFGTHTHQPVDTHLMRQPLFVQALELAREAMPEASRVIGDINDGTQRWGNAIGVKTQRHMSDEVWRALGAFAQWQTRNLTNQKSSRLLKLYQEPANSKSDLYHEVCTSNELTELLRNLNSQAVDKPRTGPDISGESKEHTKQGFFQGVLCIVAALDCIHPLWTEYVTEYARDMNYGTGLNPGKLKNQVPNFISWLQDIYKDDRNHSVVESKWEGLQEMLETIGIRSSHEVGPILDGAKWRWPGLKLDPPQDSKREPTITATVFPSIE